VVNEETGDRHLRSATGGASEPVPEVMT